MPSRTSEIAGLKALAPAVADDARVGAATESGTAGAEGAETGAAAVAPAEVPPGVVFAGEAAARAGAGLRSASASRLSSAPMRDS